MLYCFSVALPVFGATLASLVFAFAFLGCGAATDPRHGGDGISSAWCESMDRQRAYVAELTVQHFDGERPTGSAADYVLLQRIVDARLIERTETWKLQALGVVFGDALATYIPGLAWKEVTDEFGTSPVLVYLDTSLKVGALTIISKRIEDDEEINIPHMAASLREKLVELKDRVD